MQRGLDRAAAPGGPDGSPETAQRGRRGPCRAARNPSIAADTTPTPSGITCSALNPSALDSSNRLGHMKRRSQPAWSRALATLARRLADQFSAATGVARQPTRPSSSSTCTMRQRESLHAADGLMVRQAVGQELLDHDFPVSLDVHLLEAARFGALAGRLPSCFIEWPAGASRARRR